MAVCCTWASSCISSRVKTRPRKQLHWGRVTEVQGETGWQKGGLGENHGFIGWGGRREFFLLRKKGGVGRWEHAEVCKGKDKR